MQSVFLLGLRWPFQPVLLRACTHSVSNARIPPRHICGTMVPTSQNSCQAHPIPSEFQPPGQLQRHQSPSRLRRVASRRLRFAAPGHGVQAGTAELLDVARPAVDLEGGPEPEASYSGREDFCVVNFYHLTDIEKPHIVLGLHRQWLHGEDVKGRIYISFQGINAQLSGPQHAAHRYAEWVAHQTGFEGLRWTSDPVEEHQFPRLRLQFKENLVQLAGGMKHLPITKPENRATPLDPDAWQTMLREAVSRPGTPGEATAASASEGRPKPVVLDVRNGYEWDGGHFQGAARPTEEHFHQTPTDEVPEALQGCSKDAPIMMYCTGGIRCDVYSTVLREKGFNNLYTLHGGVANYMREKGSTHWNGSLFTFDNRLAVAPEGSALRREDLTAAAPCKCCGGTAQLPHLNCANLDCNKLFLACPACQGKLRGCCCEGCLEAPRFLRPPKTDGHYSSWHTMAGEGNLEELKGLISEGRGEGRFIRRQKRTKRLRAKYAVIREERAAKRALVKAAMAAAEAKQAEEKSHRIAA